MALPIAATPKLGVADTKRFLKRVEKDLKKPVKLVLPRIDESVKKLIRDHANRQKQNN